MSLPRPPREAVFWALLIAIATTIAGCATRPLGDAARASHAAQLLSRAIAIATVNPPGNEAALAEFLVQQGCAFELESRALDRVASGTQSGVPLAADLFIFIFFRGASSDWSRVLPM